MVPAEILFSLEHGVVWQLPPNQTSAILIPDHFRPNLINFETAAFASLRLIDSCATRMFALPPFHPHNTYICIEKLGHTVFMLATEKPSA